MNLRELAEALFLPVVGTIFALTAFQPLHDRMVAGRSPVAVATGKVQSAAGEEGARTVRFVCTNLGGVPQELRAALKDVYEMEADAPPVVSELEVCITPAILHNAHTFRVVALHGTLYHNARGQTSTRILGKSGAGPFADLSPPIVLLNEGSVVVHQTPSGPTSVFGFLEIEFPEGAYRWVPMTARFEYWSKGPT